jgi:hypothetical protein
MFCKQNMASGVVGIREEAVKVSSMNRLRKSTQDLLNIRPTTALLLFSLLHNILPFYSGHSLDCCSFKTLWWQCDFTDHSTPG